jgi:exopolysaccharide biosynthesis protein
MRKLLLFAFVLCFQTVYGQWKNVDSLYGPLPPSIHVYFTDAPIDTGKFRAFYVTVDLKDKKRDITTDTTKGRRLTPAQFYTRNGNPVIVVNGTFFSFETNSNLNLVMRNGEVLSRNLPSIKRRGADTGTYYYPLRSAIGIEKKRRADVAWTYTGTTGLPMGFQHTPCKTLTGTDSVLRMDYALALHLGGCTHNGFTRDNKVNKRWKMKTAIGGGPVLLQEGQVFITNEQERRFTGKELMDKHPRTAMGYTKKGTLIILVVEGRNPEAGGATLEQEARILQQLGCIEALNLDGGGSSCLLVNGKETIKPSDKDGQRPVPAVLLVH